MDVDKSKTLNCSDMISLEEKIKLALEENVSLKSHIERMNSECMELNATLFEEANKMVYEAMSKEQYAVRQAKEKIQENEILQSEVRALKSLVSELSSSITNQKIKNSLYSTRMSYDNIATYKSPEIHRKLATSNLLDVKRNNSKYGGLEQFNRRDLLTAMITHRPCKNNLDVDTFEEFLEWLQNDCPLDLPKIAFTELNEHLFYDQEESRKDETIKDFYQKEINRPNQTVNNNHINQSITNHHHHNTNDRSNHSTLSNGFDVHNSMNYMNENRTNDNNNKDEKNIESNHSGHNIIRTIVITSENSTKPNNTESVKDISTYSINNPNDSQIASILADKYSSSSSSSSSLVVTNSCIKTNSLINNNSNHNRLLNKPLSKFIYRLFLQDIKPCFEFIDRKLIASIYKALPELGLEITPITAAESNGGGGLHRNNNVNSSDNETMKTNREHCALMPKYEAVFHMKIRTPDSNEIDCKISLPARDRLVAVVNLFQYLSIIKRGLDSSPMLSVNRKTHTNHHIIEINQSNHCNQQINYKSIQQLNNNNTTSNDEIEIIPNKIEIHEQQFRTIQRHRLNIALARLGYGAPDLE
ncbi:unnamed protein product [Schistosoma turkestanicum]|nr:unnamed protein product [Schistosoma turkestanicum]